MKRTFFLSGVLCGFLFSSVFCESDERVILSECSECAVTKDEVDKGVGDVQVGGVGGGVGKVLHGAIGVGEREASRAGLQPLHCSTL